MASPRFFATAAAFRAWLAAHGASATELLVGFHKVDAGRPGMTRAESVDEALCFGWIEAWTFFEATPPGYRKVMVHWITTAKRAATRASRLATLMQACSAGERLR